jgi:hypothetical protein
MVGSEMANVKYTVNTGEVTPTDMGRLTAMNGYAYPNRLTKVYDGQTITELPQKCAEIDFSIETVYTWM